MEQVMTLFNKVYGFAKGLSRREEQQKRYQKKIKDLKSQNQAQKDDKGGKDENMLNELFEVGKFINDNSKNMMDRYMEHLVKVLVTNQDEFMKRRYEVWKNWGQ